MKKTDLVKLAERATDDLAAARDKLRTLRARLAAGDDAGARGKAQQAIEAVNRADVKALALARWLAVGRD